MQFNPDETFWDDLLTYVDSGCVIPVLGQGAITYGDSDQPFYPWLARRLAEKLGVSVLEDAPAPSLNDIVCRHLLAGGGSNLVYLRLSQILVAECPEQPVLALEFIDRALKHTPQDPGALALRSGILKDLNR